MPSQSPTISYPPSEVPHASQNVSQTTRSSPSAAASNGSSNSTPSSMTELSNGGSIFSDSLVPPTRFNESSENLVSKNPTRRMELCDKKNFDPSREQKAFVAYKDGRILYHATIRPPISQHGQHVVTQIPTEIVQRLQKPWPGLSPETDLGPAFGTNGQLGHTPNCRRVTRYVKHQLMCFCLPVEYENLQAE